MSLFHRQPNGSRLTSSNAPVTVFGVIPAAGLEDGEHVAGVEALVVRQLAALLEDDTVNSDATLVRRVAHYRGVVETVFRERPIIPVPFGTVFRSIMSVARWLELHYSPLTEALDFVADRATMRVRVAVAGSPATGAAAQSLDGRLWGALRGLKGDAVAALPVVPAADTASDRSATCAYLIERGAMSAFQQRVAALTSAEPHFRIEVLGPLPAYDFVQMDFGG